jgi:hypothetical protein
VGTADKVVDLLARHLGEVHEDQEYVDYAAARRLSHCWQSRVGGLPLARARDTGIVDGRA